MTSGYRVLASAVVLSAPIAAQDDPRVLPAGYTVETIEPPPGVVLEVGGLACEPGGGVLVCTRIGEVWRYADGRWSLCARGLHEPLGLLVDGAGRVFVTQRPELTELVDEDGDGRFDVFRTVCAAWGISDNYHEYAFGLVEDDAGYLYGTLNLAHATAPRYSIAQVGGNITMARPVPWRGWVYRVSPDGVFEPWACGLRSPAGIGRNAAGEIFYTDNQGDWVGTSALHHVVQGGFYGHPSSLYDHPDFAGRDFAALTTADFVDRRRLPTVQLPHGDLANSPGEPTFDETGGRFGPFAGQVFIGDQTRANVVRVFLEQVEGEYQGAAFDFVDHLQCGVVRSRFDAAGRLWLGETARGWGSAGKRPFGLQRLVWDGATIPAEMLAVEARPDGFHITFTVELDPRLLADPATYRVSCWHYLYHSTYGSEPQDLAEVEIAGVDVAADGRSVGLRLASLPAPKIYRITLSEVLPITNRDAWYTLNRVPRR